MNALVSKSHFSLFVKQGSEVATYCLSEDLVLLKRNLTFERAQRIAYDMGDLKPVSFRDESEIRKILLAERECELGIQLFLQAIDSEHSMEDRLVFSDALNDLLISSPVFDFVLDSISVAPIQDISILVDLLNVIEKFSQVTALINSIIQRQEIISKVKNAWDL